MKKYLIITSLLLALTMLCGCSLLAKEDTTEASEITLSTEVPETEPVALESWGPSFVADGTMQQVAYQFISKVFPDTWKAQLSCETSLTTTKWGIGEDAEKERIPVYLTFAVYATEPSEEDEKILHRGNVQNGTEELEGALILTRYCYLEKQPDGSWQAVGFDLSW